MSRTISAASQKRLRRFGKADRRAASAAASVAAESPPVCLVSAIAALSLLFLSLSMVRAGAPLPVCL